MSSPSRPAGVTALSLFFVFGSLMSGLTALMLLFPGSGMDVMWRLHSGAHEGLTAMGTWAVLLMAVVSAACVTAAVGLWRCRQFGFWTALAILSINMIGDTANAAIMHDWRTLVGVPIGAVMLVYLLRCRRLFAR